MLAGRLGNHVLLLLFEYTSHHKVNICRLCHDLLDGRAGLLHHYLAG